MDSHPHSTSKNASVTEQQYPRYADLTILIANDFVGKRFALGCDGKIEKTAAGNHSTWEAVQKPISTASEFVVLLESLSPDMALVLGRAPDLPEQFSLSIGGIRRTRETFQLANGPGWLLLDFDTDQMPVSVKERIAALGGPLSAIEHVWPELKVACRIWKPSSSGGVHKTGEQPPKTIEGFHLYVRVSDQSKSKEILDVLQRRAWAEGLGWIKVSASGAMLTRSIFDTTVWGPERLVFAGPPELGEGVSRTVLPPEGQEGLVLDPPQLHSELEGQKALCAAKEAIKPKAVKEERNWRKKQVRRMMDNTNVSARAAYRAVESINQHHLLEDDATLEMNDGSVVRVGDLLDRGRKVDKLAIPSPLDGLSYGTGKATLLWGEGRAPVIVDHAHGLQRRFRFARFAHGDDCFTGGSVLPKPSTLSDHSTKGIIALLAKSDMGTAGPNAVAVTNRLFFSVPAQRSVADLVALVKESLPASALSDEFYQALHERLSFRLAKRKTEVLAPYSLNACSLSGHDVLHVDILLGAFAEVPLGVVVVQAPMGTGKTQHVGVPLVQDAKELGLPVMAICHRTSLTSELARRLGLANYSQVDSEDVARHGGIAVCLPSTTRADIVELMPKVDVVFIDEVRQVLAFLENPEYCRTADATAAGVYERLRQLISKARTVIVADAHIDSRTLQFLEECRPRERFQIIIAEPQQIDRTVEFRYGPSKRIKEGIVSALITELAGGGKVWLACESSKFAQATERYFSDLGYCAIAITAETKNRDAQKAFLEDAEQSSLSYDIVIASPVISCGLSIEHRGAAHFTLVAFLGSGAAITPGDALQQLARVRYVNRFLVGVMQNNSPHGLLEEQLMTGRAQALALQADEVNPGRFDRLVIGLKADQANGRADFAAGLYWLLEC